MHSLASTEEDPGSRAQDGTLSNATSQATPDISIKSTPDTLNSVGHFEDEGDGDESDGDSNHGAEGVRRWIINPAPQPRKLTEKRRADAALFEKWVEQNRHSLAKRTRRLVDGDGQSVLSLMRDFENKKIITNPRDYQLELFERAKIQNTIAVLDTGKSCRLGSGKTLIAALLLRWTLQNEVEDRAKGLPKRTAFFLVGKVALVFQQYAVLSCNLDYPIDRFCGEMVEGVESGEFWAKTFTNNMAIVCTADILQTCLSRSWIRMDQINLLIFDEAHHTKKNHPYACIIKDFYLYAEKKPRILGMTASPVDAKVAPEKAAAELEALLHSQIATVADPAVLQQTICKPKKEVVVEYDPAVGNIGGSKLQQLLREDIGNHYHFRKSFSFTYYAISELGTWCAERYWQLLFESQDVATLESKTVRDAEWDNMDPEKFVHEVRHARETVESYTFAQPRLDLSCLSTKVLKLLEVLRDQYKDHDSNRKCIVFVQQRNAAIVLADLFQQPEIAIPGVQVGILMGNGSTNDNHKVSFRDQILAILKFRNGDINCLFATSVAEEGLDIPDCNVIIRFDLYNTLIQYIQSRGRARQDGSEYVHMVERHNNEHKHKIDFVKNAETALRTFCQALPEDRKLTGNDYNMEYFLRKDKGQRQFIMPGTGAKLNYRQSLVYLAAFVACLPHPPEVHLTPQYLVISTEGGYQCEVILPAASPITSAVGRVHSSKAMAKCSAAYEMCLKLIQGKYLDAHLRPVFTKQLHAMRNARLAISSRKTGEYNMRIKPEIWSSLGEPTKLYAVALTLSAPNALGRPSSPLLLLTRHQAPLVASFPLFFGAGRSSLANCIPIPGTLDVEETKASALTTFTLRIFEDIFSKLYEAGAENLPYFLAPTCMDHSSDFSSVTSINDIIDWKALSAVQEKEKIEYAFDKPDEFFQDKLICDPFDGSRKYVLLRRRPDMKPTDMVPEGVFPPYHRAWRTCPVHDIYNYSISLWSKSRGHMTFSRDQPVVEAELLPIRRNILDDTMSYEDAAPKICYLILEPMKLSALPLKVVAMAYNFPAIIHRIDSNLIALDACRLLGLDHIRPDLALEAFTKDSDNSGDHDEETVNFQGGMGNNYERLEFLGDCFLKMATTISLFTLAPDLNEADSHVERMLLICNRNLLNNALEVKLAEYVRSMAFNRRSWYPEGLVLKKGKRTEAKKRHLLADKSIADVCEALIGAAYLTGQERDNSFDMAVQAVSAVVQDKNHSMKTYAEYYAAYQPPKWQTAPPSIIQQDMADRFHPRLGYRFRHPQLLRSAFHHPTYPSSYENLPSYQRLEFLGDALLDMACVDHLFRRFPGADPQWLTEHKMAMVSNQFLGCLGFTLGFHQSILSLGAVQDELAVYVGDMAAALQLAKDEAVAAGRPEADFRRSFWVEVKRAPKCLPDVVEAYVGAMFVDSGYDYATVQDFFDRHVKPWFEDMRLYDAYANNHPINQLQRGVKAKFGCGDCRLLVRETGVPTAAGDEEGGWGARLQEVVCGVMVHGQVLANAVAESSRYAKISAAKSAMQVLERMGVDEFRGKFGCECAGEDGDAVMEDV